jgi:exodeoxyribonuclease VII large subunit
VIYSVTEITGDIRGRLEGRYGRVCVRGEISGFKRHSSGHLYFTLKDRGAQLRAAMFRGSAAGLRFLPADGLEVLAQGTITLYEPRGDLQIVVRTLVPSGLGALMQSLEALKRRLAGEGCFDAARKRPLPAFPRTVAVVTSPTGAAVRDLFHILSRRWPPARRVLLPVRVQGEGAAGEIAAALDRVSRWGGADIVIVGRGGGSIEDLWAFNEEAVVRAICRCRTPVISAVGHETDVTLSDLAADVRAPTPSAAAELAVPDRAVVSRHLEASRRALERRLRGALRSRRERLTSLVRAYGFRRPDLFLARDTQRVDDLAGRLLEGVTSSLAAGRRAVLLAGRRLGAVHPRRRLEAEAAGVRHLSQRLERAAGARCFRERMRVDGLSRALVALDPTGVLGRGYCLARDPVTGGIRTQAAGLVPGSGLLVQFRSDRVETRVERIETGGPRELEEDPR